MSRIRSIHPGFFTDERLVQLSMAARLLFIGLCVEADDQGIFEWKPITLKMRIFPADNLNMVELLAELEALDAIKRYEIDGRGYGAIRNFRKFQRPKSPTAVHPITSEISNYVCLTSGNGESIPRESDQFPQNGEMNRDEVTSFPQKGEIAPQMEDGGDKMEDEGWKEEGKSVSGETRPAHPPNPETPKAVALWNDLATELALPTVAKLTKGRKTLLEARLRDCGGLDGWQVALAKIRGSPFLLGQNDRGWKAHFDFLVTESKFTKLMEGAYDGSRNTRPTTLADSFAAVDAYYDRLERQSGEREAVCQADAGGLS